MESALNPTISVGAQSSRAFRGWRLIGRVLMGLCAAFLLFDALGGATATHVRIGQPFWFPVVTGAILWIAYALRSANLRALILSSSSSSPPHKHLRRRPCAS